jgi:hypothetical protein
VPTLDAVVDVFRQEMATSDFLIRRVFAQFEDRLQLDLAVLVEGEVRRGDAAPDFVAIYWSSSQPSSTNGPSAYDVSGEQVQDWTFLGWRALLDADKYLQRGSLWEAHGRLHEARELIWKLWATAQGAAYPWRGLSQVLDHDPDVLPPGIEATVVGLDRVELRRAMTASATALDYASKAAAQELRVPLAGGMAAYARRTLNAG